MPIYEYQCSECGHKLEVLQKISDDPLTICPACEASALKKLISAVGFRLSGTGWYETDFKTKDKRNISGDREPAAKSEAPGSDNSKPETGKKDTSESSAKSSEASKKSPEPSKKSAKPES